MPEKRLAWCPIAASRFPYPDMDVEASNPYWAWNFARLTVDSIHSKAGTMLARDVAERYPLLPGWLEQFPALSLRNVKLNMQIDAVDPHVDFGNRTKDPYLYDNNAANEPCGYRVLLSGSRTGLYLMDGDKRIDTVLPDDTDVYVLGQTWTMHGVYHEPGRRTMFLHFEINPEPHGDLIRRSLDAYGDRAIYI